MEFLNLAKKRKSVYEYSDRAVADVDLKNILEAGRWSPNFGNLQPWKFYVIEDAKKIEKIMESAFYGGFHTNSPMIIVPVLEEKSYSNDYRGAKNGKSGFVEGNLCLAMAAMSMIYAAEDLGINTAIITPKENLIQKILGLKEKDFVPICICVGYEKKGAFQKKRERKELKEIVVYEDGKR